MQVPIYHPNRTFYFEYRYEGGLFGFEMQAEDEQEAWTKIRLLASSATFIREGSPIAEVRRARIRRYIWIAATLILATIVGIMMPLNVGVGIVLLLTAPMWSLGIVGLIFMLINTIACFFLFRRILDMEEPNFL